MIARDRVKLLGKVSLRDVLQEHSLGAEEGAVQRDCVTHRVDEAGAIAVKERDDHLFKLVVKCSGVLRRAVALHRRSRVDEGFLLGYSSETGVRHH